MSSVIICVLCSLTVWRLCVRCGRRGVAAWWRPSPWAPSSLLPTAPPPCYCSAAAGPPEGGDRTKTSWEDAARTLQTHQSAERRHRAALQVSVRSSCTERQKWFQMFGSSPVSHNHQNVNRKLHQELWYIWTGAESQRNYMSTLMKYVLNECSELAAS